MAKLVCEDCGEVLETDITESEANSVDGDSIDVEDRRDHSHDNDESQEQSGAGGDENGEEQDDEQQDDEQDSGRSPERNDDLGDVEDDIEDEYDDKMEELKDEEQEEDVADDVGAYSGDDGRMEIDEVLVSQEGQPDVGRWNSSEKRSEALARVWKDKLRQKQRNEVNRERRSGRFDNNKMIEAERGSSRVFKKEEEGDDPDYEVYIVLDRSGSMDGQRIERAERATATLMMGLEDAGMKTELVDFVSYTVRLVKTKSQDVGEQKDHIVTRQKETGGGTPINSVMDTLTDRIEKEEQTTPFIICVTDAAISGQTRTEFENIVQRTQYPVLGLTVGNEGIDDSEASELYHYYERAERDDDMTQKLFDLARGVVL